MLLFRTEDNVSLFFQVIAVALAVAVLVIGGFYGAWLWFAKDITGEQYSPGVSENINIGTITENSTYLDADLPEGEEGTVHPTALDNLQENIKKWANTGVPAKDDNVTNLLLIGIDVDSKDMSVNSRADAMVIASFNHKDKTVTLASIMRDQYCYIEHGSTKKFEKFHHANSYGGPSLQIEMIEKYYKVAIDNYALVNFYSLPKIIDKLGGVTVTVTKAEADYMNSDWGTSVKVGQNTLDGETALIYMRIRHQTGGDEARTGRQQAVIKQILQQLKTKSKAQLVSLVTEITGYIRTGYSADKMLALATDALVNGWFDYTVKQLSLPDSECSTAFTVKEASGNIWYWKVDYPLAAQKLQLALYNKSNIVLEQGRKGWIEQ